MLKSVMTKYVELTRVSTFCGAFLVSSDAVLELALHRVIN